VKTPNGGLCHTVHAKVHTFRRIDSQKSDAAAIINTTFQLQISDWARVNCTDSDEQVELRVGCNSCGGAFDGHIKIEAGSLSLQVSQGHVSSNFVS
jgi:hypothetical protein